MHKEKWKLLVIDDELDVHDITKLVLHDFSYMDKPLYFISAFSAKEAKLLIEEHPDVAVILLDAVMETDDAGLQFVEYLRKERGMSRVRIVLRTGQAGHAPERYVIDNYDIDDYKNKAELTSQRLYTTVRSALKNYRDLQEIEALYERILQSEKMAAVGQIAGGLLHDLKNAMAGIHLSTQLMKDATVPLEKKIKICNIMATKFAWIQEIVEDIFDFSRGWNNLKLEPMGVMEVLNPVLEGLQADSMKNAVTVKTKISFQGKVRVNGAKIKRCLMNLCKNALDATLKAHQEKDSELILSVEERGGRAFFSVSDNGCGIEEKHLSKIWEPFFTHDKNGGTGLGLSVVKQIVEGHGGAVRIDSQIGRGSTFTFDLEIVE